MEKRPPPPRSNYPRPPQKTGADGTRLPRVRLSWAARLAILESEATVKSMPSRQRRDLLAECVATRRKMTGRTCSVVWFEDYWRQGGWYSWDQGGPSRTIFHSQLVEYPPTATTTPMQPCLCRLCRNLRRVWPFGYVRTGCRSYECFLDTLSPMSLRQLPGSHSIIGEAAARRGWTPPDADESA